MNKNDMAFECKFWGYFCSVCELDGKDCDGDNVDCPNYVDVTEERTEERMKR